jgi:hypothetical protein
MVDEASLRSQMLETFESVDYPVANPMELLPALSDGPSTRFESGDFSMSVIELHQQLDADFPYDSAEAMVDHIIEELKASGKI